MRPATNTQWTGMMKRRLGDRTSVDIPISCHIFIETNRWLAVYNTAATTNGPAEKLVVIRYQDGGKDYHYWRSKSGVELPVAPEKLTGAMAAIPLAGSDFLLSDLGLEFLHWPTQRLLAGEMRRGQPCYVLESLHPNPTPGGYARVRSWIQKEHLGLLLAEAYDSAGRQLKEFSAGSFVKDGDGHYQLKDMEIRSIPGRSRTRLEFDVSR
jgi:hypothetical protein